MEKVSEATQGSRITVQAESLVVGYRELIALRAKEIEFSGNVIAIVGHNGAGKSTLMKLILDLLPPREGNITISENRAQASKILRPDRHMAFCPEEGAVFADITVESYIKLWCRVKQQSPNYYKKAGSRYIELLNLSPLLGRLGRELSKGQRRRVQTAIGFLAEPRLFLVDEPFDGLDVQKTSELAEIVERESEHMSFLISSHRMDVVERIADTVVVLQHGRFVAHGSVDEVCKKLCPTSVLVEYVEDPHATAQHIRDTFQGCLVTTIGSSLRILGNGYSEADLARLLSQHGIPSTLYHHSTADLVDAMNFHLRDISK